MNHVLLNVMLKESRKAAFEIPNRESDLTELPPAHWTRKFSGRLLLAIINHRHARHSVQKGSFCDRLGL